MGFNSIEFLIFFPLVVCGHFLLPYRWRWAWLLAGSYGFYMFGQPICILLLLGSTGLDYWAGLAMAGTSKPAWRRFYLVVSLAGNLGLLFAFKYWNLFSDGAERLLGIGGMAHDWLLPIGLSFYTFQSLSYTIDVYRGNCVAARHFGKFALYVAFFPQLVAGPIERSTSLLPQFNQPIDPDVRRMAEGVRRMAWGFFKKLVIADPLGRYVDLIYGDPSAHVGWPILLATYCFAFQIYCDFSAYTDIAIGAARVLGFRLMENFRHPYGATSVREFWRRWHISLSTWFRDYLYVPLGGNRRGGARRYLNLLVVFALAGLWHGANWTFLLWGLLHALYMMGDLTLAPLRAALARRLRDDRWRRALRVCAVAVTFHLVTFGWLIFRASSPAHALELLRAACVSAGWRLGALIEAPLPLSLIWALVMLALMHGVEYAVDREKFRVAFMRRAVWQRWLCYYALGLAILLLGRSETRMFIYFQF